MKSLADLSPSRPWRVLVFDGGSGDDDNNTPYYNNIIMIYYYVVIQIFRAQNIIITFITIIVTA